MSPERNHEGALIDWIGSAGDDGFSGILLNPGALTHSSYAPWMTPSRRLRPADDPRSTSRTRMPAKRFGRARWSPPPALLAVSQVSARLRHTLALTGLLDSVATALAPASRGEATPWPWFCRKAHVAARRSAHNSSHSAPREWGPCIRVGDRSDRVSNFPLPLDRPGPPAAPLAPALGEATSVQENLHHAATA